MLHSPSQLAFQQVITAVLAVAELLLLEGNHVGGKAWGSRNCGRVFRQLELSLLDEFLTSQAREAVASEEILNSSSDLESSCFN